MLKSFTQGTSRTKQPRSSEASTQAEGSPLRALREPEDALSSALPPPQVGPKYYYHSIQPDRGLFSVSGAVRCSPVQLASPVQTYVALPVRQYPLVALPSVFVALPALAPSGALHFVQLSISLAAPHVLVVSLPPSCRQASNWKMLPSCQ